MQISIPFARTGKSGIAFMLNAKLPPLRLKKKTLAEKERCSLVTKVFSSSGLEFDNNKSHSSAPLIAIFLLCIGLLLCAQAFHLL